MYDADPEELTLVAVGRPTDRPPPNDCWVMYKRGTNSNEYLNLLIQSADSGTHYCWFPSCTSPNSDGEKACQ